MSLYWADQIADKVMKEIKELITVASGITPSGSIHIGNLREEMTADIVFKALEFKKAKARYIHSWDDFDRLRKVPGNVPKLKELEDSIGMPVSKVIDPWKCHRSYAEHFMKEFEEAASKLGISPSYVRQSEMHQSCKYAEGIRTALKKRKDIEKILSKFKSAKIEELTEKEYWPCEIYCEKCWHDSTEVTDYDDEYQISYRCACGHVGSFDFRKVGNIKLKWRIDWPMRWAFENVSFEPGGKDHSTPGGSRTTAAIIVKEIYGKDPPIYQMYDFVTPKGGAGKMSSSKGNVVLPKDLLKIYLPEIVRELYAGTKPVKEFSIPLDDEFFKVYDDFYRTEKTYFTKVAHMANERKWLHVKRIYELSMLSTPDKMPEQLSPQSVLFYSQIYDAKQVMKIKNLSEPRSLAVISNVINWTREYGEKYQIKLNDSPPEDLKLTDKQKKALRILADELDKDWDEQSLQDRIYSIKDDVKMDARDIFEALYRILINKPVGPRAGEFILMVGKERVKRVLEQL